MRDRKKKWRRLRDPSRCARLVGVNVSFNYIPDREASMRRSQEALARLEAIDPQGHLNLVARKLPLEQRGLGRAVGGC